MEKTSKFYNPEWTDYYCDNCGVLFQLKIGLKTICTHCREPLRKEMHKLLIPHYEAVKKANIEFKKNYVNNKQKRNQIQKRLSERGKQKNKRNL